MPEKRADELVKGDVLLLKGDRWTVVKAKVKGKHVRLTIDGRRGSFTDDVKARTLYDVVEQVRSASPKPTVSGPGLLAERVGRGVLSSTGPLTSPSGAQTRWAKDEEHRDLVPPAESPKDRAWDEVRKAEREIVETLGAKLVAVEVEGGKLVVPPVTDSSILGHLATMHGVRFDGVSFAEAKVWGKANPADPRQVSEVFTMLELEKAYAVHDREHVDFAALSRPHWHREKAPR